MAASSPRFSFKPARELCPGDVVRLALPVRYGLMEVVVLRLYESNGRHWLEIQRKEGGRPLCVAVGLDDEVEAGVDP